MHPDYLGTNSFPWESGRFDSEIQQQIGKTVKYDDMQIFDDDGKPNLA